MKESKFIKNNIKRWQTLSKDIQDKSLKDKPGKMSEDFLQIGEDYSFSKTYYKSRSIKGVLNNFAAYLNLQFLNNKFQRKGILYFVTTLLPYRLYHARKPLQLSLVLFMLFMIIGALSAEQEENLNFIRQILGEDYVDMTLENIKKGDPMYVYKDSDPITMQIYITFNNLYVALISFVLGITGGIGSFFILLKNGIMVGAFQYMFVKEGLGLESFLAIWMHGSTEIPAIIISGGAGLILAKGMFFPGHMNRLKSFQKSAREATSVFLGVIPLILFAGFVESFLTRLTMLPDTLRFIFIFSCFFFTFFYFFYFPYKRKKQGAYDGIVESGVSREYDFKVIFYAAKSGARVFSDAVNIFLKNWTSYLTYSMSFALVISLGYLIELFKTPIPEEKDFNSFSYFIDTLDLIFKDLDSYFNIYQESIGPLLFAIAIIICLWRMFVNITKLELDAPNRIDGIFENKNNTKSTILGFGSLVLIIGSFLLCYNFIPYYVFKLLILLPLLISISFSIYFSGRVGPGFSLGIKAFFNNLPAFLGLISLIILVGAIGLIGFILLNEMLVTFLSENLDPYSLLGQNFEKIITQFTTHFYLLAFILFLGIGVCQFLFMYKEKNEALSLMKNLDKFGNQEKIKGLIRE
jgi:uncharacterized membrane protein SpoIIM required for sporulation